MGRRDFFEERKFKKLIYVFSITLAISIIVFLVIFVMYNKKLKEESNSQLMGLKELNNIVSNDELDELEETSLSSDKTISEANKTNTITNNNVKKENKKKINKEPVTSVIENNTNTVSNNLNENNVKNEISNNIVENTETKKELSFIAPVSGEIMKDFAMDTLVYSNTLEEWTTHSGVDIKANKTTIVVASETGIVETIKTDPRYGLTITITHSDGFKTIYSNLLTAEFVTEGQTIQKGETIATVGESSSFEIADEPHLHFEMYKDGISVNPTIYLKDK